jgi:hypothetical protein
MRAFSGGPPVSAYSFLSHLSLALASAVVCHCILKGSSAPPSANAFLWSITYPGQLPLDFPVDGQGFCRSNFRLASWLLSILPFPSRVQDAHLFLLSAAGIEVLGEDRRPAVSRPELRADEWRPPPRPELVEERYSPPP